MTAVSHQCRHAGAPCPLARTRYQATPQPRRAALWGEVVLGVVVLLVLFGSIAFMAGIAQAAR
jgi:hypothetical protein